MKLSQKFRLTNDNKTLRIANVTIDDKGFYTCKAVNSIGESKIDFELNVLPSEKQFETSIMIPSGTSIFIGCRINSENPKLSIVWIKQLANTTEILSNEMMLVRRILNFTLDLVTFFPGHENLSGLTWFLKE